MRIASHRGRGLVTALVLAAFGLHALIPEGYMPGGGRLSIRICPDAFPRQLLTAGAHLTGGAQHRHGGSPSHTDHCAFGSAGPGGPPTSLSPLADAALARDAPAGDVLSPAPAVRLVHLPQPRGPPTAA